MEDALDRIRAAKTRKDAAAVYADALREWTTDGVSWPEINGAILARWSVSGLDWIKKLAWKEVHP